jgi:hypothetical protein
MPHLDKLSVEAITAGFRFIAKMEPCPASRQLLNQFADMIRTMRYRAPVADLAAALVMSNRDRNRRLMDIKPDERVILHAVSPPSLRLGTGQSGATLQRRMPRERPPSQSDLTAIMGSKTVEHLAVGPVL